MAVNVQVLVFSAVAISFWLKCFQHNVIANSDTIQVDCLKYNFSFNTRKYNLNDIINHLEVPLHFILIFGKQWSINTGQQKKVPEDCKSLCYTGTYLFCDK